MLQKQFYGKQVVVLLGAGASAGRINGTAQVTQALKSWTKFYVPSSAQLGFQQLMNDIEHDPLRNPPQTRYFEGLYNALSNHYTNAQEFLHFERLIHVAQTLDQYTSEIKNSGNDYLKVGAGPLLEFTAAHNVFDNKTHGNIAAQATAYILGHLANQQALDTTLANMPLNQFLHGLSKKSYIRLHSLNYDTIPLNSGIDFKTGYVKYPSSIDEESFSPNDLRFSFRSHIFCQLHGSIQFGYASEETSRGLIVRFSDIQKAISSRSSTAVSNHYAQDGIEGLSQLMITGLRKADAILHDPFASYFSRLSDDLLNCDAILIVGYGGHDKHVNEIFQRAYAAREELGLKNKIVWVDFSHPSDFSGDVACQHRNVEAWKKMASSSSILPKNFINSMRNEDKDARLKLYRSRTNIFSSGNSRVLFSLQGGDDTFKNLKKEILEFLIS